jgi:ATP-dependent DNA helicase RecG
MVAPLRLSDWPEEFPDEAAFWKLLGRLEDEQTELKSSASHVGNAIPAMAMTDGGFIVLGIDDKRRLAGCQMTQKVLDTVKRAAANCEVDVQLKATKVGSIHLTVVAVPEIRERIVTTDGRLLRRVGSDCQPLRGDAMARFVRERENRPAEESVVPGLRADQLRSGTHQ